MTPSLLTTAAARKAELLAELAKIEALAKAGETVAAVADPSSAIRFDRTTMAVESDSAKLYITDPALVLEVRQFIAGRLEALALAEAGQPAPVSPQSPTEPQPAPAPEIPAARSVAAEVSTPTPEPEVAVQPAPAPAGPDAEAIAHARAAGAAHRTERNGTRVSPYKPGPLTDAWLSGWDAADAAAPKPAGPARGPVRPAPVARPAPAKPAAAPDSTDDLPF